MNAERRAIIVCGIPGSGKSSCAQKIANEYATWEVRIHSTDSFFEKESGYCFDPTKLGYYHKLNLTAFENSLSNSFKCVICDNTNLRARDRKPYILAARKAGYDVEFIIVGDFDTESATLYAARNSHGVPLEKIIKMARKFQAITDIERGLEVNYTDKSMACKADKDGQTLSL